MRDRESQSSARAIVLMGPSGSGKTTIGVALAAALSVPFIDADSEHSPDSVDKMRRGIALSESERGPWLARLHVRLLALLEAGQTAVLACSALRRVHRDMLTAGDPRFTLVYLSVPADVLAKRLAERRGHFAGPELLASQLAALEPPDGAITIDGIGSPADVVSAIQAVLIPAVTPGTATEKARSNDSIS